LLATARGRVALFGAILIVLLAVTGTYVYLNRKPAQAQGSANLTIFTGTVSLLKSGTSGTVPAKSGDVLGTGDFLTTGPVTRAAISFPDQTIVRLDSNTQLRIKEMTQAAGGGHRIEVGQEAGKTWTRVGQLVGGSSFKTSAPNHSTAETRGTTYLVVIEHDARGRPVVRFDTFEGSITVRANGQTVAIPSGQSTTIAGANGTPTPLAPIPLADSHDQFTVSSRVLDTSSGTPVARVSSIRARGSTRVTVRISMVMGTSRATGLTNRVTAHIRCSTGLPVSTCRS